MILTKKMGGEPECRNHVANWTKNHETRMIFTIASSVNEIEAQGILSDSSKPSVQKLNDTLYVTL